MEKLIHKRLTNFLIQNNFFLNIKDSYVLAIFLDLAKAFDTVDHQILLFKMERAGIRGPVLNFIKSFLLNRQQFVCVSGNTSALKEVLYGVP